MVYHYALHPQEILQCEICYIKATYNVQKYLMKTQRNPICSPSFHTTTTSYKTLSHFTTKTHNILGKSPLGNLIFTAQERKKEKETVSSTSFHSPLFPYTNPLIKPESLSLNSTRESTNESSSIIKQFLPSSSSPLEIQ